jgi:hypothetical protein
VDPPIAYGKANASIAAMKLSTLTVVIAGTSNGSVTRKNRCRPFAPSSDAASSSSSGIPPRAAPYISTGKPTHCHTATSTTTHNAVSGLPSHGCASAPRPIASRALLIGPNVGESRRVHRYPITIGLTR